MGFININGNSVHTSSINTGTVSISNPAAIYGTGSNVTISSASISSASNTNVTISNSTGNFVGYSAQLQKTTYHILGEDLEVEGWVDASVAMIIATINVLGKQYYDELKKQQVSLPKEIEKFLKNKFIVLERDRKIDEVIKK